MDTAQKAQRPAIVYPQAGGFFRRFQSSHQGPQVIPDRRHTQEGIGVVGLQLQDFLKGVTRLERPSQHQQAFGRQYSGIGLGRISSTHFPGHVESTTRLAPLQEHPALQHLGLTRRAGCQKGVPGALQSGFVIV